MYGSFYKEKLYPIQDRVLKILDSVTNRFYLTGGTALSRCYLNHRYSDDLDFFQNAASSFAIDVDEAISLLETNFQVQRSIKDTSFYRVFVLGEDLQVPLKVEWINDVQFHKGPLTSHPLFSRIDSIENILSNKITALSRNAAKDFADILFISLHFRFSWKDVIEDAKKKDAWVDEVEASKIIHGFNPSAFTNILWIEGANKIRDFSNEIKIIARDLLHGFDNSLFKN